MSDYVKSTDFASKDTLPSGDSAKIVRGTEIDAEFEALEVAIATKANTSDVSSTYAPLNSPTFTGSPVLPSGTTAVTQTAGDNDTSVATTAFVTTAVAALGYPAFKNRIINGAMMIDQRNAGASVTQAAGNQYSLDRWNIYGSAASKFTFQQNAGAVTPPAGYTNYLGITSSSAYSVSSTDIFMIRQFIEGYNIADLGWGAAGAATVTLSFWVRSSLTGTFGGVLQNYTDARAYPFTYTISAANTWEQKTVTVTGDTSGTWSTTNTGGITVTFGLGVGSSKSTTAGSWAAGGYYSATGATSVVGTSGATFYITGVQLEKGSTATAYDYRPYGTELALCQRYFQSSFPVGVAPQQNYSTVWDAFSTTTNLASGCRFIVPMRATPTITTYNPYAANSSFRQSNTVTDIAVTASSITSGNIAYWSATISASNILAGNWAANAEL